MGNKTRTYLIVGFLGHHKCATHWLDNLFRIMMQVCDRKTAHYSLLGNEMRSGNLKAVMKRMGRTALSWINCDWDPLKPFGLEEFRAFHVVRDPRDILVSGYYSHKYSHGILNWPEMMEQRRLLHSLSEQEGMMSELDFYLNVRTFKAMEDWDVSDPRILTIKFEDLIQNPRHVLTECFHNFLGLENEGISLDWIESHVAEDPFKNRSGGRERGQEDVFHHYRKGIVGDWKNHLTPCILERLELEWGCLLDKYGYR